SADLSQQAPTTVGENGVVGAGGGPADAGDREVALLTHVIDPGVFPLEVDEYVLQPLSENPWLHRGAIAGAHPIGVRVEGISVLPQVAAGEAQALRGRIAQGNHIAEVGLLSDRREGNIGIEPVPLPVQVAVLIGQSDPRSDVSGRANACGPRVAGAGSQ